MAQASRQVATSAEQLGSEAHHARNLTLMGRERSAEILRGMQVLDEDVQETARHVQHLAERSQEMGQVIDLLTTLAHQTNRLALDAAIQATMTGEHGKGFQPVAQDMRRLAERTKEEVSRIEAMLRRVKEEIQAAAVSMEQTEQEAMKGDCYVRETETVFMRIFTLAEQQSAGIDSIIEQSRQQGEASSLVEMLMQEVSAGTQVNTETLRGMAGQISEVARKASSLEQSIGAFRVRPQDV